MWDSPTFVGALTPKFYVALTGTSSLISGLILIFEWWYFRKYGTSFIEQVSLAHLGPWLGGGASATDGEEGDAGVGAGGGAGAGPGPGAGVGAGSAPAGPAPAECKVWRNPMSLLRGAEYGRLWTVARRAPLTYYDMNLSAQEHQAWFGVGEGEGEGGGAECDEAEACMARAWREREPSARVAAARAALAARPDCAPALLLLAEEDAPTVLEAERVLRRAWRAGEAAWRARISGGAGGAGARRQAAVLAHVKRRLAMCARRLGRLRDAARMFRELARDAPPALHALHTHENLIEVLLEQRAYADVQAVVARYEECASTRSACSVYTTALLRARAAAAAAPPTRQHLELAALEAMRRAVEFNPHVPAYLLELRALSLPPEHVVRRGDSEALAYAFCHLQHWRHVDGALRLLALAVQSEARGRRGARAGRAARCAACGACGDRELLGGGMGGAGGLQGGGGRGWARSGRRAALAAGCVCVCALLAALAAHCPRAQALHPAALLRLLTAV